MLDFRARTPCGFGLQPWGWRQLVVRNVGISLQTHAALLPRRTTLMSNTSNKAGLGNRYGIYVFFVNWFTELNYFVSNIPMFFVRVIQSEVSSYACARQSSGTGFYNAPPPLCPTVPGIFLVHPHVPLFIFLFSHLFFFIIFLYTLWLDHTPNITSNVLSYVRKNEIQYAPSYSFKG